MPETSPDGEQGPNDPNRPFHHDPRQAGGYGGYSGGRQAGGYGSYGFGPGHGDGAYGPSMNAQQHEFRLRNMEIDALNQRIQRLEECLYELAEDRHGGNMQRGRSASGRFTSGPGRAGSRNRASEDDGTRSLGYEDGYDHGHRAANEQRSRYNPSSPMQHGYGHGWGGHGGYGPGYYDPMRDALLIGAFGGMQYGPPPPM